MNDEQRGLAAFGAQPGGTGPIGREPVLRLTYVRSVHCARRALARGLWAAVAAVRIVLTGPSNKEAFTSP